MKEIEILGLICLMYDYSPNPKEQNVKIMISGEHYPIDIIVKPHDYLKRKGYLDKREGRPTLKFYKLLDKYCIKIKQLKEWQDEYEATGHVTQHDKYGNKHIL